MTQIKKRTWEISWFVWNNGKGVKTKSVFKTVNTADYFDRQSEKSELKDQAYIDYDLHRDKIIMMKEVQDD